MAARAMWKAVLRVGDAALPVKLYAAVQDRAVHFRLLHAPDRVPVSQRLVDPRSGAEVRRAETRKGAEVTRGVFVVLDDAELEALAPPPSRDIVVEHVVDPGALDAPWYEQPYWLGPDGNADGDYFALADALRRGDRVGLARWTMRGRRYVGALRAAGTHLMLYTLRHADEVVPASRLEAPPGRALAPKELALAEQLVAALADEFDPTRYRDEHRDRVRALIERKARGEAIERPKAAPRRAPASLERALAASLRRARTEGRRARARA